MPLDEQTLATFPEEIRGDPTISNFNDVGSIAKSYVEARKMLGDSIRFPGKDSTVEEQQKWWSETSPKLTERGFIESRPESPDKYEFKFDGVDNEVLKSDALVNEWRKDAHELGLSNKKAQALMERLATKYLPKIMPKQEIPESIEGEEAVKAVLMEEFKHEFPKRTADFNYAISNLKTDNPQLTDIMKESVVFYKGKAISAFDHPVMRKIFSDFGAKMQQDFGGNVGGLTAGDTLESLETQIQDIRRNKELDGEEQGRRLMPLYQKKQVLMNNARKAS